MHAWVVSRARERIHHWIAATVSLQETVGWGSYTFPSRDIYIYIYPAEILLHLYIFIFDPFDLSVHAVNYQCTGRPVSADQYRSSPLLPFQIIGYFSFSKYISFRYVFRYTLHGKNLCVQKYQNDL
jgi:hypothetical protein